LGPLPNTPPPTATSRPALDRDDLVSLGGEASARIDANTILTLDGQAFSTREATLDGDSTLDFARLYGGTTDNRIAYAYAEWSVAEPSRALATFGSDDGAVVWHNGKIVHRIALERPLARDSDRFVLRLAAGVNRLLVKVDNGAGAWAFDVRVLDAAGERRLAAIDARRHIAAAPAGGDYMIHDSLPALDWSSPAAADAVTGSPAVRWFGPDLEPLGPEDRVAREGQYTAVVTAQTRDGYAIRQALAFAKVAPGAVPSFPAPPTHELPVLALPLALDTPLDDAQRAELSRHFWAGASAALQQGPEAAVAELAMTRLGESPPPKDEPSILQSGFVQVAEHELAIRRKLEGRETVALAPPAVLSSAAPELRRGSEREAGLRAGTTSALGAVARAWAKDDPHPFVVLVARHGVIVMHEGFNGFTRDSTFYPASLGKTIAALTFARAVDQGLLAFDQPVGSVLPDWRAPALAATTFRRCFYHVTGLSGHASHGGMFNAYLDNALAVRDAVFAKPLTAILYNGDDVNLAGKALELVTGKSIWRLLYENMQKPFGEPVDQLDLGFGNAFNAMYMAKVGQMILQDGRYGRTEFFKRGFLASLWPGRIESFVPELSDKAVEAGIGLAWMTDPPGPRQNGLLGPNVIGHGAASGSVWRVDPDHGVIIVVGRSGFKDGAANVAWTTKLVKAVADGL
jgi:CubicO group peptidase (beta-lactamase class C family)